MRAPQHGVRSLRWIVSQLARVAMIVVVALLIGHEHASRTEQLSKQRLAAPSPSSVQALFPQAASLDAFDNEHRRWPVLDANEQVVGYILLSSPEGDRSIGFSGPTRVLIGMDMEERIRGLRILASADTHDHIRAIETDPYFLRAFDDLTPREVPSAEIDAVSGATLSSDAIRGAVVLRLTGAAPAPRFDNPIPLADIRQLFPDAARAQRSLAGRLEIFDEDGLHLGGLLRTSPACDSIQGYGGPTEAIVALDVTGRVVGVAIGKEYLCTYDNEPYVSYVREDEYFRDLFNGQTVDELGSFDLEGAEIDGVSGATMTSMSVAEGIVAAAQGEVRREKALARDAAKRRTTIMHVMLTASLIALATFWKRLPQRWHKLTRMALLVVAIVYLGMWRGELVSQAMLIGWIQNGIPLQTATSFALLAAAAILLPAASGNNVYCHHLCPHGALQQLVKHRISWQVRVGRRLGAWLKLIPSLLLVMCVVVAMRHLPLTLVNIEPFDAWLFPVAAIASIAIAIVGIAASLVTPMAYCRYGCPTGALLESLRFHRRAGIQRSKDWLPTALLLTAVILALV